MSEATGDRKERQTDNDLLSEYADDCLNLFRINLVVLAVFISISAFTFNSADLSYLARTVGSVYTITGALLWVGSIVTSEWDTES